MRVEVLVIGIISIVLNAVLLFAVIRQYKAMTGHVMDLLYDDHYTNEEFRRCYLEYYHSYYIKYVEGGLKRYPKYMKILKNSKG